MSQNSGDNGSFVDTSLMSVSNIAFVNWTGVLSGKEKNGRLASFRCSKVQPYYNIDFINVTLAAGGNNSTEAMRASCEFVAGGGDRGVNGNGC